MTPTYKSHPVVNGVMVTCGTTCAWFWYEWRPHGVTYGDVRFIGRGVFLPWNKTPPEVRECLVKDS